MPLAKRIVPIAVTAIAIAAASTGCSTNSDTPTPAPTSSSHHATTPAAPSASAKSELVTDVKTQPGLSQGYTGALKDVTVANCDTSKDPATFSGTVQNPEGTRQSYRIYVSLVSNAKTLGISEVDVNDVAGGAQQQWQGSLATDAAGAQCILRVERTPA